MKTITYRLIALLLIVSLGLAACGGDDKQEKKATPTENKPVIRIAEMPWLSNQVTAAVAKLLLEEQLGYKVEIVPETLDQQWTDVASGTVHAQLEVWTMSSKEAVQKYIEQDKTIEYGGDLGAVGQGGWFVPGYLVNTYPELRTWEGFKDPAIVALFTTPETGSKGRLLSGSADWVHSKYAESMIQNLGLDFQVVNAGSEEAELAVLDAAYQKQEPILIYYWTPSWVLGVYSMYKIELPPYTDACYADVTKIACDYPPDVLGKALWPGLKNYAPPAYQFLKNFQLTSADQIHLMVRVQIDKLTADDAAREWIKNNEAVWKTWIPAAG